MTVPDVESKFRQHFRRELRSGRFIIEFALSAPAALERVKFIADASLISEPGTFRKQRLRVDDLGKQFVRQISPSVRLSGLLSDDRQRWQLRARGARQRHCALDKLDEIAPSHEPPQLGQGRSDYPTDLGSSEQR
jgi:hypothetical protein